MEHLVANLSGKVRREQLHGRDHLVAPLTLLREGVLAGSQGALFYPQDEINRNPAAWNHVPVTLGHPAEGSARTPDVLNKQGVGVILGVSANGKLSGEAWFDTATLRRIDNRVLAALEAGKSIEISTGLFTDNEPAEEGAAHNGTPYKAVARNYRPDHLAVLLEGVGACSIADGCGVLVNEEQKQSIWQKLGEMLGVAVANVTKKEGTENLPASAYAFIPDTAKPSGWKLRIDDKAHVAGAVAAIGKGYRGQKAQIPAADLPAVKKKIRAAWLKFNPNKTAKDLPSILTNKGKDMTDEQRKAIVDNLVANDCCWNEDDRETLDGLSEDQLQRLGDGAVKQKEADAALNMATKDFTDQKGVMHTWKDGKWAAKEEKKKEPVANKGKDKPKTADEWLGEAPAKIQSAVRNAMAIEAREKEKLANRLLTNVKDDEAKAKQQERLMARSLEDLQADTSLLPEPIEQADHVVNYAGAATGNGNASKIVPVGLPGEYLDPEKV